MATLLKERAVTAYRRDDTHWTAVARRTRITKVAVEHLSIELEPLYVSSSFLTTSLGCLSYSAAENKITERLTKCSNGHHGRMLRMTKRDRQC